MFDGTRRKWGWDVDAGMVDEEDIGERNRSVVEASRAPLCEGGLEGAQLPSLASLCQYLCSLLHRGNPKRA